MVMRCASERECLCSYAECGYDAHCAPLISCVSECTAHLVRASEAVCSRCFMCIIKRIAYGFGPSAARARGAFSAYAAGRIEPLARLSVGARASEGAAG